MRTEPSWRGLGWRLGLGAVAAVVVVVLGRLVGLLFDPFMTVLLALLLAAGSWFLADQFAPAERPMWQRPQPEQRAAAFLADTRTRRMATVLARAQPGAEFETATVARTLAELLAARGFDDGRHAGARGPAQPAEHSLGLSRPARDEQGVVETTRPRTLSPELTAYLEDARDGRARPLTRRALHAHLKEIDQL